MTDEHRHVSWDEADFLALEEAFRKRLEEPMPMDPAFQEHLRQNLLLEHQRLYRDLGGDRPVRPSEEPDRQGEELLVQPLHFSEGKNKFSWPTLSGAVAAAVLLAAGVYSAGLPAGSPFPWNKQMAENQEAGEELTMQTGADDAQGFGAGGVSNPGGQSEGAPSQLSGAEGLPQGGEGGANESAGLPGETDMGESAPDAEASGRGALEGSDGEAIGAGGSDDNMTGSKGGNWSNSDGQIPPAGQNGGEGAFPAGSESQPLHQKPVLAENDVDMVKVIQPSALPIASLDEDGEATVDGIGAVHDFIDGGTSLGADETGEPSTYPGELALQLEAGKVQMPKEAYVYSFSSSMFRRERENFAESIGFDEEEERAPGEKSYLYKRDDGASLVIQTGGVPVATFTAPVNAGTGTAVDAQDGISQIAAGGRVSEAAAVRAAAALLAALSLDDDETLMVGLRPLDGDKYMVTFTPQINGIPNLAGKVSMTVEKGRVSIAEIPLVGGLEREQKVQSWVSLDEAVWQARVQVSQNGSVKVDEVEVVYYHFNNSDVLVPAYRLNGTNEANGQKVAYIIPAQKR